MSIDKQVKEQLLSIIEESINEIHVEEPTELQKQELAKVGIDSDVLVAQVYKVVAKSLFQSLYNEFEVFKLAMDDVVNNQKV